MLMMTLLQESVHSSVYHMDGHAIVPPSCMATIVSTLPFLWNVTQDEFQLSVGPIPVFANLPGVGVTL